MIRTRIFAVVLLVLLVGLSYAVFASERLPDSRFAKFPFKLGLDLAGGTELTYRADVSKLAAEDVDGSMNSLRDVIERRVNVFGVSEPIVQVEETGAFAEGKEHRLIVGLPGVTDVDKAVALIGKTPLLEFMLLKKDSEQKLQEILTSENPSASADFFEETGITGRLVERAQLEFTQTSGPSEPAVSLTFNSEGRDLIAKVTKEHVNEILAIFLDGSAISMPYIRQEITDGKAQISGNFTAAEARELVRDLNYGSLPVPIELIGTQTIGPSLGSAALAAGVKAGIVGSILVALFLILWYRFPGFIASVSLVMYIAISLAIFKLIPVTLTAAGLAGFILSIGMAVDANVLIFERLREELARGKGLYDAMHEGFRRAWLSIRDSNISSLITAIVLFWIGTSSVKGFALTFGIGVFVSMFTAITASRIFLYAVSGKGGKGSSSGKNASGTKNASTGSQFSRFLFSSGFHTGATQGAAKISDAGNAHKR